MLANEDFWDDLLGHLSDRVLVPVVGPELVTVPDGGRLVPLYRLLGERLAERYRLAVDWREGASITDAVGAYLAGRADTQRLYRVLNDLLTALDPPVPETLRQLVGIRDFRLFISLTFDSLLTQAVNEVRFGGHARARDLWFSPNQSTPEQQDTARIPRSDELVVFRLFGRAASTPVYAVHEEDTLEWLHALLTGTARLPDWLTDELKQSPILFVGCDLSDWLGRVLTRMTSTGRLSLANKQFFIVSESVGRYPTLTSYFQTFSTTTRVQVLDASPAAFVAELSDRWRARHPDAKGPDGLPPPPPPATKGTIFISYVREDVEDARRLAGSVAAMGGDVWLDERRLQPGDLWEAEILSSIRREIRLFLPVISQHTERRDEGYVFREWYEAAERAKSIPPGGRRFIVPVVIDPGYDGNPSGYRRVPEAFTRPHWGRAPEGRPDAALADALRDAIRESRRKEPA
jgi:hypothetical protein